MFKTLSYPRFVELAKSYHRIAVYKEVPDDQLTPINAFLSLQNSSQSATLLESYAKNNFSGQYSHLCCNPVTTISAHGNTVIIESDGNKKEVVSDPFVLLRAYQSTLTCKVDHPLSGFLGGMVGFMSYDAIRLIEDIPGSKEDAADIPDILFRFYRDNITFDHQTGKVVLSTVVTIDNQLPVLYQKAMSRLDDISTQIFAYKREKDQVRVKEDNSQAKLTVDVNDNAFGELVNRAKTHIKNGDVFQIVLSREFSAEISAKPFDVYQALRELNPSPYMFYIETDDYAIAGASPEKLISIKNRMIESCPLAGTRARGHCSDITIIQDLLSDEKEIAEHMMLVDLARNDLGKVSIPGSVKVTKLKKIEKYSRVMHISSTVQGELSPDKDVFDAIQAVFPTGTLSGAPKIRAMELIEELEMTRRGIYGGIVCGIDHQGNLESCLAIRTAFIKDGVASVRAGAGIVYDSKPQAEADETVHKAKAIIEGILLADGKVTHDITHR